MNDDEIDVVVRDGGAEPGDKHLAADIVAVDAGIVKVIAEHERRRSSKERRCRSR